jgi:hypothetical protein
VKNHNPLGSDDWHQKTKTLTIHHFDSIQQALDRFIRGWGPTLSGTTNMQDYVNRLEDEPHVRCNSQDPAGYKKLLMQQYDTLQHEIPTYRPGHQ